MGQPRPPVIPLLLVMAAAAALLPHPADTRPLHGAHVRKLAAAKADATSTGGTAVSVSDSQGKSDVTTISSTTNGGTAVAIKSANDDASHIVSSASDGNSSFTYSSSTPKDDAWDSAPACRNSSTATFDDSMRLWGWENNAPCAFKEETAAAASTTTGNSDAWDTAPPCKQADTDSTKDNSGRLWGWEDGVSCAFKAPGDGGDAVWEAAQPCSTPASDDNVKSTDNRGRQWGWENGASCAFKGVPARKMLSFIYQLNDQALQGDPQPLAAAGGNFLLWQAPFNNGIPLHSTTCVHVRKLAAAKADATSTGGTAVSVSDSHGKSDVTTVSSTTNGGTAVAVKSANDDASHIVSSASDGNSSFTYSSSTPKGDAWDSAPACRNSSTATFEDSMRLWGWENNAPCAFKEERTAAANTTTGSSDAWDTAPPCKQADTNSTKDNSGRLWGWEDGVSCAFKAPGDGGDAVWEAAQPCSTPASDDNVKSTDNRGRQWGWENGASCAFKGVTSRKLLGDTDALNLPAGQMVVSTLSYGDDVECAYADDGTPSIVNCKKKAASSTPAGTNRANAADALPSVFAILPAFSETAAQPASNTGSIDTSSTNVPGAATLADELTDTTSDSTAAEPLSANAVAPVVESPAEEPAGTSTTTALPATDAVVPAEEDSAEAPSGATATNALPGANAVAPAEDYPMEEPAAGAVSHTPPDAATAFNMAVPDVSSVPADTAGITGGAPTSVNSAAPSETADAFVPVLGADYNVAYSTPTSYIIGGVKGAAGTFGKPVTADIPNADVAATTPPAAANSAPPASLQGGGNHLPAPAASPATDESLPSSPVAATSSGSTWETAPVCAGQPTKRTSVQDLNGRLWWVVTSGSTWASCAYRAADGTAVYYEGFQQVQFDSSPACEHTASVTNSMADSSGRLWGWKEGQTGEGINCRFLKADGTPVLKVEV